MASNYLILKKRREMDSFNISSVLLLCGSRCRVTGHCYPSLRASSPIWASEVSLARTRERGANQIFFL